MAVIVTTAGMTNPMTTSQDLIVAGTSGNPARLGVGANGQVLTVTAGVVGWAAASSGFANPMTTAGDIIKATTGGTAQRLAVGSNGQVLTVVSGAPAWAATAGGPPSGSAGGDLSGNYPDPHVDKLYNTVSISGAGSPTLGQVLTAVSGTLANWQRKGIVLQPSGNTNGTTDDTNFNAAVAALSTNPGSGGTIYLLGDYYNPFYTAAGWTLPAQTVSGTTGNSPINLEGIGMPRLIPATNSASPAIYNHRTSDYGTGGLVTSHQPCSVIRNLIIDGKNTTGAQIGLDQGDGNFYVDDNVVIMNYTGAGAIGFYQMNRVFWTEKGSFHIKTWNCTFHVVVDTGGAPADSSHEYNFWDIYTMALPDQCNFVCTGGSNMASGHGLRMSGNYGHSSTTAGSAPTTITGPGGTGTIPCCVLGMINGGHMYNTPIFVKLEQNSGTGNSPYPIYIDTNASSAITNCNGSFATGSAGQPSNVSGECSLRGNINADAAPGWPANNGMSAITHGGGTATTIPTTGTAWNNQGSDCTIGVSGGTVSNIRVNSTHGLGVTSGAFFVPAGATFTIFYTVAPTVVITPVGTT